MDTDHFILFGTFLVGAAPLVWQDARTLSVSPVWLWLVLGGWVAASFLLSEEWTIRGAVATSVVALGGCGLLVRPQAMGEADVIFLSGLAWLLPFWAFLFSVGLACILGLATYWVAARGAGSDGGLAVPFLPCLALGGMGVMGGMT